MAKDNSQSLAFNVAPTVMVQRQWDRYTYARDRGHKDYIAQARKCERFYIGGGEQWDKADKEYVESVQGRKAVEVNTIFPAVNTAIGEQLQSRADISFRPRRAGATDEIANTLTELTRQICDDNQYDWLETEVYSDGIIQQRGYLDIRMDFSDNLMGDIRITVPDPVEIIPDPDANGYDPKQWNDVIVTRWLSIDEIGQLYGKKAALAVENERPLDSDFGIDEDGDGEGRNRFGNVHVADTLTFDAIATDRAQKRVRVIDRQWKVMVSTDVYLTPNGDLRPVPANATEEQIAAKVQQGYTVTKQTMRRVRWTVSTQSTLLHDDWSPYSEFTIVPYFPYFRRGKTRGLIDNAISPQEMLNKATSQYLHIINTSANSGWVVEDNSLVNLTPEDLQHVGMKTGLVLVHKKGTPAPQKIQPNSVPPGHDRLADKAEMQIKSVTGISDAEQGLRSNETSGTAIQARQWQAKIQLATPLDNLKRTRHIVSNRIIDLIQQFYTFERVFRITKKDITGKETSHDLVINGQDPVTGEILNNVTMGEYDVVVDSVPHQATMQDTQFSQLLEMKKVGISIPDTAIVNMSTLANKNEILEQMQQDPAQAEFAKKMQELELDEKSKKIALLVAQAMKQKSGAQVDNVETLYSAMQAAQVAATIEGVVPVADEIAKSAGFVDQNAPPIYPEPIAPVQAGALDMGNSNTSPMFPDRLQGSGEGMMAGIETLEADGIR